MNRWPRRDFILGVLGACGTTRLFDSPALHAQTTQASSSARARMAAVRYLGGDESARVLGEAFMAHLNLEVTAANVREASRNALAVLEVAPAPEAATKALQQAVRRDFLGGRIIRLHGWVLSRTELELCALSLVAGQSGAAALPALKTGVQ